VPSTVTEALESGEPPLSATVPLTVPCAASGTAAQAIISP
jgi:hypothetical protein